VDVLVALAEKRPMYLSYLSARLTRALGRDVEAFSAEEHNRVVQGGFANL
jgi:hypothetical protein